MSGTDNASDAQLLAALPPRPWAWTAVYATASGGYHAYLTDANDRKIAAIWGNASEKPAMAELIVRLVNNAGSL